MKIWNCFHTSAKSAQANMEMDSQLLHTLCYDGQPIFRTYDWERPSVTYGHFIEPFHFLRPEGVLSLDLDLAKRPTGGGVILHGFDLAFSVLIPVHHPRFSLNTMENYAFINQIVIDAIKEFLGEKVCLTLLQDSPQSIDISSFAFCMAKPTKYDVMLYGKKVAGGAQRRTKNGYLHQGSICLVIPPEAFLTDLLIPGTCVAEAMKRNSFPLLNEKKESLVLARKELSKLLAQCFAKN